MRGVHQGLHSSIGRCDPSLRPMLYGNIVLAGGNTMFPGLEDRLGKEVAALAPPSTKVDVVAPPDRALSAWVGGSIMSSLSTFGSQCMTREEYEDVGPGIVHRKR